MKIGILSAAYAGRYGLEAGIKKMKLHGYECCDFGDFIGTDNRLFTMESAKFKAELLNIKEAYAEYGIEISQAHGPWRYPPCDFTDEDRAERFEKMSKSVYGTALLGCKNFVIHPIMPFGISTDSETGKKTVEYNLEFMSRLCDVGRENGVYICIENMPFPNFILSRPKQIKDFTEQLCDSQMKICLDTGHCTCLGESAAQAVKIFGKKRLAVLHVHDNDGKHDYHRVPYSGVTDWEAFTEALLDINFEGTVSLETSATEESGEEELARSALKIAARL